MRPREHLDLALQLTEGEERVLTFPSPIAAKRYHWRLRGVMGHAVVESKREFSPDDPAWGTHPWEGVGISQVGSELVLRWDVEPIMVVRKRRKT